MKISLLQDAVRGLAHFLLSGLQQELEPIRLARAGCALLMGGCSGKGAFPGGSLASYLAAVQRGDGGWGDVEETIWSLGYLAAVGDTYSVEISRGEQWLETMRMPCRAWGKSQRDQPRIPITALASVLAPDVVGHSALEWIASQWEADLDSPTPLTYKGAFFLLSQRHDRAPDAHDLIARTIAHLCQEQEDDGGFGPWKDHPVGSDPWSTGVVLWGLSGFPDQSSTDVLERAISWLESKQLPNGLWPYHYMDDGSSMALIGLSKALPFLKE